MLTGTPAGWVDAFLDSNIAKLLLLPLGYGLFRLAEYFLKRRAEGAGATRDLASLHSAADLQEKLNRNKMTLEDLKQFRHNALNESTQTAVVTAQHYVERAIYLADATDTASSRDWPEAMTQLEMNEQASAQFREAEDQLTALLVERLATAEADEASALQRAHDAWRAWRDEEATWGARTWEGGTIRPLLVSTKLEQLTRERIATLKADNSLGLDPQRTIVPYQRAPRDLPEHIEPGVTAHRVREILGEPHSVSGSYWHYRFQETRLDIFFEGEAIKDVSFLIIEGQTYTATLSYEEFTFGTLTFGDLLDFDSSIKIEFDFSARTNELIARMRLGPAGAWSEYYFGAVIPLHGGGQILNTDFQWDRDRNCLLSTPSSTLVNWFGQTSSLDDHPRMSWFIK